MERSTRVRVAAIVCSAIAMLIPVTVRADGNRPARSKDPGLEVSRRDISASNRKVAAAYSALVAMWTKQFRQLGDEFDPPRIARYEGGAMTACGFMDSNNAEYCPDNNTIYYDDVFVAAMVKSAANALGTDGDMAGLGIIAHEMGHAVAIQLGHQSHSSYRNESVADCLAGAFTRQSDLDGYLEKGDIEEALFGLSMAGDPTPEPTGNRRVDAMIRARLVSQRHGTKDERMNNFRVGLKGGPAACLDDFRGNGAH